MRLTLFILCLAAAFAVQAKPKLQTGFDPLGPTLRSLESPATGRTIHYIDEGRQDWRPVVLVGGGGTSGRVFALLEFLRTTRENLRLRFISVERNGFGATAYDAALGFADYADDVDAVLEQLGIGEFSLFAISGGGPYAARIAARHPGRLRSLHLASALTWFEPDSLNCQVPADVLTVYTQYPMAWFSFPAASAVHRIPGFQDAAFDDAARTFNLRGQAGEPDALHHELRLYCDNAALPDLTAVTATSYLYYGEADDTTPPDTHLPRWRAVLANAPLTERLYPDEAHDAQYRHLDQILVDLSGAAGKVLVCDRERKTRLVGDRQARKVLAKGGSLGLCAWRAGGG